MSAPESMNLEPHQIREFQDFSKIGRLVFGAIEFFQVIPFRIIRTAALDGAPFVFLLVGEAAAASCAVSGQLLACVTASPAASPACWARMVAVRDSRLRARGGSSSQTTAGVVSIKSDIS